MRLPESRAGAQPLPPAFRAEPTNTRRQSVNHPGRQNRGAGQRGSFNQTAPAELLPHSWAGSAGGERRLSPPTPAPKAHCWNPERKGQPLESRGPRSSHLCGKGAVTPAKPALLYPCATALNQNDQQDDKQNAGGNPNNQFTTHFDFPLFRQQASFAPQPEPCSCAARASKRRGVRPGRLRRQSAKLVRFHGAARVCARSVLLDPSAATLNQNDQQDDKQNACNNPNNQFTTHFDSSFLKDSSH